MLKKNIREDWEIFYGQDMNQLGDLFETALREGLDIESFIPDVMNSETRVAMDNWHPMLSNCDASDIIRLHERELFKFKKATKEQYYPENCLRWIGMMYGYLIYYTSLSSKELYKECPLDFMLDCYIVGHEMSIEGYAERLCGERICPHD